MLRYILLPVFFLLTFHSTTHSWDSTAAMYYPMSIGNTWSIHSASLSPSSCIIITGQSDYIIKITGDTVMPNSKRYFKFSDGTYQRIDSNKMNVYKYSSSGECLLDSLFARLSNCYDGCRYENVNFLMCVSDTSPVSFGGQNRKVIKISSNPLLSEYYTLMQGIGFYYHSYCEFGGIRETLNGCIINGVQYGVILGYENPHTNYPLYSELFQNYPNPFNPSTNISYQLSSGSFVSLKIYDVLGREVGVLVNEFQTAGMHSVNLMAEKYNLTAGVYFYRLITGNYSSTKKMILLK